jgi:hypothetical protein
MWVGPAEIRTENFVHTSKEADHYTTRFWYKKGKEAPRIKHKLSNAIHEIGWELKCKYS